MAAKVYETTISGTEGKSLKKYDLYDNSSTEILLELNICLVVIHVFFAPRQKLPISNTLYCCA